jgi:3-methyl-2-oxobutanoate hydroxymethyltransferase
MGAMKTRKTVKDIRSMKGKGEKVTILTAYDASMARLLSSCEIDILLVGDSLGMVMLGYDSTIPVTMEQMLHHCAAVRRGAPEAFVVGDMPFGSYQCGSRDALINGTRLLKEAGCDAVKLEGGLDVCDTVKALVRAGIPVMGHIGLTPQTAGQMGGYKVQGRDAESARRLYLEARALEEAGVFSLVLECVPAKLAEKISASLTVATIGIGAGVGCDGQVLVTHDLLGMFDKFTPSFVKKYANLAPVMKDCISRYKTEVKEGTFPDDSHSFATDLDLSTILPDR